MAEIKTFLPGDTLVMKKNHACSKSAKSFLVIMAASDVKIKCANCGREIIVPRIKIEKSIKNVISQTEN
ncbi:MAG: DUF951 domain-containing protein [Clostridia bacterium]|nr:DUF951 domain-containing protein [Clostridia bacterium]